MVKKFYIEFFKNKQEVKRLNRMRNLQPMKVVYDWRNGNG